MPCLRRQQEKSVSPAISSRPQRTLGPLRHAERPLAWMDHVSAVDRTDCGHVRLASRVLGPCGSMTVHAGGRSVARRRLAATGAGSGAVAEP
jgi:hypothetical protein